MFQGLSFAKTSNMIIKCEKPRRKMISLWEKLPCCGESKHSHIHGRGRGRAEQTPEPLGLGGQRRAAVVLTGVARADPLLTRRGRPQRTPSWVRPGLPASGGAQILMLPGILTRRLQPNHRKIPSRQWAGRGGLRTCCTASLEIRMQGCTGHTLRKIGPKLLNTLQSP